MLIDGAGFTLDGGGVAHNFLNYAGPVTFKDLAIVNAVASVVAGASWSLTGSDTITVTGPTVTKFEFDQFAGAISFCNIAVNNGIDPNSL